MKYLISSIFILMAGFFFTFQGNKDKQIIHIKKGSHFVPLKNRTFKIRNRPTAISWDYIFQDNCNYDLGDVDQRDWNKLTGLYFNFFNTRAETVMVGWRYNTANDNIELSAYYHIDKGRDFSPPLLSIKRNEKVNVTISVDYQTKEYTILLKSQNGKAQHSKRFFHNRQRCGQINFYFGGNRSAPQDISISMKEISTTY